MELEFRLLCAIDRSPTLLQQTATALQPTLDEGRMLIANKYEQLMRRVESDEALSTVLSSALRLARENEAHALSSWVELELMGYKFGTPSMTGEVVVPEYRTVNGQWYDAFGRQFLVTDPNLAFVNEIRLRDGVAEIERYVTVKGELALPMPDFAEILKRELNVEVYWFRYAPAAIAPILARIRSQLVQWLISCRSQLEISPIKQVASDDEDVIEIRPNFYGIGINFRALWRRWRSASGEQ